mgnify:CR=1 FL=1
MISAVLQGMSLATCLQDPAPPPANPYQVFPAPAAAPLSTPAPAPTASPSTAPAPLSTPAPAPTASPSTAPAPLSTPAPAPTASPSTAPAPVAAPLSTPAPAPTATPPTAPAGPVAPLSGAASTAPVPYQVFQTPPGTVLPGAEPPPAPRSRFVFAFLPSLTFGISAEFVPSQNVAFFFGGRLPGDRWALGYQFTGSAGLAERYLAGVLTHRHHIAALTKFGRRGFASVAGGVAFFFFMPSVVELETRIGMRFGARQRGVFGGHIRLGHNFGFHEKAPLPQFGLFVGLSFL